MKQTIQSTIWSRAVRAGAVAALVAATSACTQSNPPAAPAGGGQAPATGRITFEQILAIRNTGAPTWAPDGREVAFNWGTGTETALWAAQVSASQPAQPGDPSLREIAPLVDRGSAVLSPNWNSIAYTSKQNIWVIPAAGGEPKKLTTENGKYSGLIWAPDSTRIAFLVEKKDQTDIGVVSASGGGVTVIAGTTQDEDSPIWSPRSDRLAYLHRFDNWQGYDMMVVAPDGKNQKKVVSETYDHGVEEYQFGGNQNWSPDGAKLVYLSNRTGYNHVWTVPVEGGEPLELTKGEWVDYSPAWQPGGTKIAFVGSRVKDREDRHIWIVDANGGEPVRVSPDGFCTSPSWSRDGARLAYLRSSATEPPEVVVQDAAAGNHPTRLTESRPEPAATAGFVEPEAVTYPSKDGKPVPAILLRPHDQKSGRPALLYFHGKGGIGLKGWGGLSNYAFHQYLVQQGYVILFINWRGTHVGYGNAWEQANYGDYAGGELDDVVSSAPFLEHTAGVDPTRIACWGGSYGGYMTMLTTTKAPDLCSTGVSLYGVSDWVTFVEQNKRKLWRSRLIAKLGDPKTNRDVYDRAGAIHFAAQAKHPILILQGQDDDGVVPGQGTSFYRALQAAGKTAEYAAYIGEGHGFRHEGSERDLYVRTEAWLKRFNGGARQLTN